MTDTYPDPMRSPKIIALDPERRRLLGLIRSLEADLIISDLDSASTYELRMVLAWIEGGRVCGIRTGAPGPTG